LIKFPLATKLIPSLPKEFNVVLKFFISAFILRVTFTDSLVKAGL